MVNYSYDQVRDVLRGRHFHTVGAFATAACSCKSKSQIVTNFALRPAALSYVEKSGYGVHAVAPCAPSLGLALTGRVMFNDEGEWRDAPELATLYDIKPAPFQKFVQRLQLFRAPTLSIVARCTCFNTYIVSVMPYTASYFGLCTSDLNFLRQQAVKFLLKRHWLESEILPYVLRLVGIAPVLDPALVATVAATGLYFREGSTLEDLINMNLLPDGCNLRQRSVVHDLLQFWAPFVKLPEIHAALANKGGGLKGRLCRLKSTIYAGMALAAKTRLRKKILEEGWSRGITPEWIEITSSLKKRWCNGVARYTILRWAVNQDDDVWLANRGTRHSQQCLQCSSKGDSFPGGHTVSPLCERCIQTQHVTPVNNCPFGDALLQTCYDYFHSHGASTESALTPNPTNDGMSQFRVVQSHPQNACIACGCGDNTIGHWSRWCIIPFTVAWIILRPSPLFQCLSDLAVVSPRYNAICTITIAAFRRLLRQEGAFFHQAPNDTKPICWWIDTLLSAVSQDAPQELDVPFFRSINMPARCKINMDALALVKVLPVDIDTMHLPPIVCSLQQDGCPGDQVATLSIESIWCGALRELQQHPPELEQNVSLQLTRCNCGEYHVQVVLTRPCVTGDILVPGTFGDPKIFVQFDGSAYHDLRIGGAGAGLFEISARGLQLLDWGCLALPVCKDNIVAEVMGADLALRLYDRYVHICHQNGASPLELDKIQGDIKPLGNHLQFHGRFRRPDLTYIIDQFHQRRSRIAPLSTTEYRPREANFVADFLAGQGSAYLLQMQQECVDHPTQPVCLDVSPPYELLLQNHAVIAGLHAGGKFVLALMEMPGCTAAEIACILPMVDSRTQRQLGQIVLATRKLTKPMLVEYLSSSVDGYGRVYARQAGAQLLPKDVRAMIYGKTHKEVDMTGAHYEILRKLSLSDTLPQVSDLRNLLRQVWENTGAASVEEEIKRFPIRIINAGVRDTLSRAGKIGLPITPEIEAIAYELESVRDVITASTLQHERPHQDSTGANKRFFALEYLESQFMIAFLSEIKKRARCVSIIWLHDGLWVPKELSNSLLLGCEQIAARQTFPTLPTWNSLFRVQDISLPWELPDRRDTLGPSDHPGNLFPPPSYLVRPSFSSRHPNPRFERKRPGRGLAGTFYRRMCKKGRH